MDNVPKVHPRATTETNSAKPPLSCLGAMGMAVAAAFEISPSVLGARTRRSAPAALARQTAMYLAHVAFGLNFTEIGRAFGRDRTTAAHACRVMEDRRDDPHLNTVLTELERFCDALIREGFPERVRR